MSVNWSVCSCEDVSRFSNESFKELIKELKKAGVKFRKMELNMPYYEGYWESELCEEILEALIVVADKLVEKDAGWIESLPDIVRAVSRVAKSRGDEVLKIS